MRSTWIPTLAASIAIVSGCATTAAAETTMDSRFIDQPGDAVFAQYGPPRLLLLPGRPASASAFPGLSR